MRKKNKGASNRFVRHLRLRKKVAGKADRLRLCLTRSHLHLEAQFIDDLEQKTLLGISTKSEAFQKEAGLEEAGNVKAAGRFGKFVASKAKQKGIEKVVFDRSGYLYHGRIKAFAEAAREAGLSF